MYYFWYCTIRLLTAASSHLGLAGCFGPFFSFAMYFSLVTFFLVWGLGLISKFSCSLSFFPFPFFLFFFFSLERRRTCGLFFYLNVTHTRNEQHCHKCFLHNIWSFFLCVEFSCDNFDDGQNCMLSTEGDGFYFYLFLSPQKGGAHNLLYFDGVTDNLASRCAPVVGL
ncbi:hypothetical protein QBC44DRAFT_112932 [Cladorrhinum sp. PSN332]|nr:hypothetical protein QBC44DRAFT_112932 [Cladorrhinum sp. PSN332]